MQEEPKNNSGNKRGESGGKQETTQQSGSTKNERFQALAPEEYVTILERISDGVVVFDAQLNYTYVNQRAGELLGRKPEELISKNYWLEYPEARGTPFAESYIRALDTQEPIVFEDYYESFDRWFENRIYPSKDGLVVLFAEITDKKKAELNLREAQERLDLAIRSANIGLWDWDLLKNKVYYSPEWKSQLGHEDHEISNDFSEWESRVHPEDLERAKETVRGYIEKPYPDFRNEFRLRHKDGSYRWILTQASLLYDERSKPFRMIGSHIDITERKQVEQELQKNEEFLSIIYNNTDVGIFVVNVNETGDFRYEGINPTHEKLLGLKNSQVAGKTPDDLVEYFGAESMNNVKALYRECVRQRKTIESEFYVPEGSAQGWWFSRLAPLFDAKTGRVIRLIGTSIIITERKRAEQALQRNEQILRLFVEHSPAAIAMFDRDMKYIVASRRYLVDYELGDQDLVGRSHYDIFTEIPERWKEIHRRSLVGATERAEEDPFPRKDGRQDWVRWEIRPWYEKEGEIGGVILFSEVITERKRMESEMKASRDRLVHVLDSITDAFITLDRDWRITYINPEAARINKKSTEEFLGKTHWEEWPASVGTIVEHQYRKAMKERVTVHFEHRYYVEGQYDIWLDIHAYPSDDGLAIYYRDISERKRAEEELRLSHNRLADLSRRLVEIHETEQRSIGRELHDQIGQMLTALKLTLEIAPQLPPEQGAKKFAQAQELVGELLGRVSNLSLELRPPMLDDLGLVSALLWHINRFQEQSGIALNFKHNGVEGKRFSSEIETTTYRIIQEALTNVARHAQATRIRLDVEVTSRYMKIRIADNGKGFDPVAALAKNRGLSGMRERASLIGGTFQVESQIGKGTKKVIHLPLQEGRS